MTVHYAALSARRPAALPHLAVAIALGATRYWSLNNTLTEALGSGDDLTAAVPVKTATYSTDAKMGYALSGASSGSWTYTYLPPVGSSATMEAWVNLNGSSATGDYGGIFGNWRAANGTGLFIAPNSVQPVLGNPGGSPNLAPVAAVSTGVWHQIVGVWTASTALIYVDGVLGYTATRTASPTWSTNQRINMYDVSSNVTRWVNGLIARCVWYPSALTAPQVASLYTAA